MIVPEVAQHLPEIRTLCQQYDVERMSIIGSATNKEKFSPETSDLDCLVKFFNEDDCGKKLLSLTEALQKTCHRPVEVISESILKNYSANHPLRQIVEKSQVVIYNADDDCS
ncbi:MAG: hypothetical protein FJ390_00145 [Verrucomicrobia bacterium]|nr:hypothetical protein [Verrucomicrobiota bacterium]